jgi:biopolymer transport protein TolR
MAGGVIKKSGGSRRRGRRGGGGAVMSEINITPFVDVMLVLLIIFMVAAPMLTVGVPIELPDTAAKAMPDEQEPPLTISITAEGAIFIQDTEVSDADMIPKLRAIATERTNDKVFLRADGALDYGRVAAVMGALNAGGFNNIGLVTDAGGSAMGGN